MDENINVKYHDISRKQYLELLAVARGEAIADYIIDNVTVLDVINGEEIPGPIVIKGRHIAGIGPAWSDAQARHRVDAAGAVAAPGFIDAHLHIESSMMTPVTFETATLPHGLTTLICDPHEIVNVMGEEGLAWFIRCAEQARQNQYIQISSCVPALSGSDVNGAEFPLAAMLKWRDHPHVTGLAEVMDYPGVIAGNPDLLDKLDAFRHLTLDGHCPGLSGKELGAYIAAGIENCHEAWTLQEGREKLRAGMALMIREGSAARNLDTLAPLITAMNSPQCMLCTDDRNPWEIAHEGHIDALVRKLINRHNVPVHVAWRLASWSPARHFGLKHLGLLAPGKQADIVLLRDVRNVDIQQVFIKGEPLSLPALQADERNRLQRSQPPYGNTVSRRPVSAADFPFALTPGRRYRVMNIIPGELITPASEYVHTPQGLMDNDICFIAVLERYGRQLPAACGLLRGFGLRHGAVAATVSHDSHNIVVTGRSPEEMALAVNQVINDGGGLCVARGGEVVSHLPLPVAGLMSDQSADTLARQIGDLKAACRECGITLDEPFIQMAFLSLPVIPELKLTSKGLFDSRGFCFTSLEIER
ncbi:adenine deaminase [[Enterobacter] lignolyticus]|uniref:Adenine deaminase n=1 Tax=Enterobacter lignolyticus (strain SCF1) TaxID=701347 RepID=E3G2Z9_ENTLS|nr:adenine deaminase [[Enterobacter] lignolyticus]ADO49266.1 adenine deaminase [[Enterobacter] lignolyticus SCF1]